ncbi:AAA family ATPase [Bosea sp. (in: a-proteobacteria)]|uniref:AAA family ATPase n=1 Tax=Bosea sp. (in: a-proteobacteria) TaxID=1871050 RepID=UPI00263142E3|nr:AAA family ATPase [Bosea sp. (in: a-proteobacteria)]MCO5091706.1 AAA family ATPase [Bosea sp. (in: a-proteobacteria)]
MPTEITPDCSEIEGDEPTTAPAHQTLAECALYAAIPPDIMERIDDESSLAMVVSVPSADWVEPVIDALGSLREWNDVVAPIPGSKKRPSSALCAAKLANGLSVVGVAVAPERQLPTALVTAADVRIAIGTPDNSVIARVIATATGDRTMTMPPRVATGLDYYDIVSAIRTGSTAQECVGRLEAAAASQTVVDATVADVPRLEEMHGYGAAGEWGLRLVNDLCAWRRGDLPFEAIDRHVVLASDPGLGKSTYVRALAKSVGLPLFVTSVASWFSSTDGYLNSVIKEVDRVFGAAAACAPAILFLDELDALPDRGTVGERNRDYWVPVITNVLMSLDSATSGVASKLIVIGATNHAGRVDPALVRPGRLNKIIHIHPPGPADMAAILRQHLGGDLPGEDLLPIAELAGTATGAMAMGWVKQARSAARVAGRSLVIDDLVDAVAPPDRSPPEEQRRLAIHEAGHAVLSHRIAPGSVRAVSIVSQGDAAAHTMTLRRLGRSPTRAEIELDVVGTLAGRAAEVEILGEASVGSGGALDSDLGIATIQIASMLTSYGLGPNLIYSGAPGDALEMMQLDHGLRATVSRTLATLHERAILAVRQNRRAIEAVADGLLRRRHLGGEVFAAIVEAADAAPRRRKGVRHG